MILKLITIESSESPGSSPSRYIMVTSGSTCKRVTSKADCEEAARQLGISDTEASEETVADYPPYCYFYMGRSLYFNNNGNATSQCNSESRACICQKKSDENNGTIDIDHPTGEKGTKNRSKSKI